MRGAVSGAPVYYDDDDGKARARAARWDSARRGVVSWAPDYDYDDRKAEANGERGSYATLTVAETREGAGLHNIAALAMSSCDAGTRDLYPQLCVRLTTLITQSVPGPSDRAGRGESSTS